MAAAVNVVDLNEVHPIELTDAFMKQDIKEKNPLHLFVSFPRLLVKRANTNKKQVLHAGQFVGSTESATAYYGIKFPYLATYQLPVGHYMILNSVTRRPALDEWFRQLLHEYRKAGPEVITEIKILHILLRMACGMSDTSGHRSIIKGYTEEDFEHIRRRLVERRGNGKNPRTQISDETLARFLALDFPDTNIRPTRISIKAVDTYMSDLVRKYITDARALSEQRDKARPVVGVITSCRSVGEPEKDTNARAASFPVGSVAVPSELIILVPSLPPISEISFDVPANGAAAANDAAAATNGGKRTRKSRKRTRKSRKRIKRNGR